MTDSFTPHPPLPTFPVAFDPVPVAARHDGWTPSRQREFIDALAVCGCVKAAAGHVGMTARSAYRLRDRPSAAQFAAVWDRAQHEGVRRIRDNAVERAIYGVRVPRFYGGRMIGVEVRYNDRLAIAVLTHDTTRMRTLGSSTKSNASTDFSKEVP